MLGSRLPRLLIWWKIDLQMKSWMAVRGLLQAQQDLQMTYLPMTEDVWPKKTLTWEAKSTKQLLSCHVNKILPKMG